VTEPGNVLLDRAQLERAFTALGERLVRRGVVADVFVVGGAAMALAYDATRVTRDVDSLFVPHGIALEEARNVAKDLGMPRGGSTSRHAFTSQAKTIRASAACSAIPACG
jgi:hypothetical protein